MNFTTSLQDYTTKVLFVYSELNQAYGKSHALLVSSAFPNSQVEEIVGCGHEMPQFGWGNFYPLIKKYLNETL